MANSTPGPWHWTLNVAMHETRIEAPSGTVFAQKWRRTGAARGSAIRWLTPAPDSIAVADAKLIAAAPALADALEALLERLTDGRHEVEAGAMEEWADEIRAALRAAGRLP